MSTAKSSTKRAVPASLEEFRKRRRPLRDYSKRAPGEVKALDLLASLDALDHARPKYSRAALERRAQFDLEVNVRSEEEDRGHPESPRISECLMDRHGSEVRR